MNRTASDQSANPTAKLYQRLSLLQQPRVRMAVLIAPLVLMAPTIFAGFAADDYILQYELSGPRDGVWAGRPPWDLYQLFDPVHVRRLIDGNGLPWWTYPDASCGFLRPISGFTHLLDHALSPNGSVIAHLQNLVWFLLLVLLVARAYRELSEPPWVVAVAIAMFALDAAHGTTVGWIVNRSAVVGAVFGLTMLLAHHRFRSGGGLRFAFSAYLCLGLGMFSTELTLGVLGYLAAYALCLDRGSWSSRALSLAGYAPVLAIWATARKLGGYGTHGLYTYVDPLHDPLAFLRYLPERIALLLASQALHLNSDLYESLSLTAQPWFALAGLACCAIVLAFAWPVLRTSRSARFWGAGAVLSAVPMGATQPSDRLLTLVGVGVMPLLAHAIHDALLTPSAANATSPRAKLAAVFVGLHLIISPLLLPLTALSSAALDRMIHASEATLPNNPGLREQTLIVAAVPDSVYMSYVPVMRWVKGEPRPQRLYYLVSTGAEVRLERMASQVLRVSPGLGFYDRRSEARSPLHPLRVGDRIELSELSVHVLELRPDGRPAVCDFEFKQPLESSRYVWRTWHNGRFEPLTPPALGESRIIPAR